MLAEERRSDIRRADDIALVTESAQDMKHQLNIVDEDSLQVGLLRLNTFLTK